MSQHPAVPFRLCIPRHLYEAMIAQATGELPNECCGLLAGRMAPAGDAGQIGQVEARYPLVNAAANPRLFESDPASMFAAHRDMNRRGIDVLAVYHSHPSSAPIPSRTDLERNYSTEVVNLIISLAEATPLVRGWWLTDRDYREAEWEVG
jgi:proteasome lid subunit RPN8/RPN11